MMHMDEKIRNAIKENAGFITFDKFMEMALYDPEKGYYTRSKTKIGASGDFYTSVSISPVFGEVLARKISKLSDDDNIPLVVCELGAGTGALAKSIVTHLKDKDVKYIAIESSPFHQKLIKESVPEAQILSGLDELSMFSGFIISNEFFDALPTKAARFFDGMWFEICVGEENGCLKYTQIPAPDYCLNFINKLCISPIENQVIEIPLAMLDAYEKLCNCLRVGTIISIDYGILNEQLLHPERQAGSVRGFQNHKLISNVLEYPGDVDITYNVLFDELAKCGEENGLETVSLVKQNEFLLNNGILKLLAETGDRNPFSVENKRNRAIRQLITNEDISNYFYCLEQNRV